MKPLGEAPTIEAPEVPTIAAFARWGSKQEKKLLTNEAPEMVPASYVQGTTGRYQSLPERPRFITLSDGQVLDRLYYPTVTLTESQNKGLLASNEASYNQHCNKGIITAEMKRRYNAVK